MDFCRVSPPLGITDIGPELMLAVKDAPTGTYSSNSFVGRSVGHVEAVTSARQRLHQSPYRGLRSISLDVNGNTMVLSGQVRTFFLKQMAQHLLGDYTGAWEIRNELRVA